MFFFPLFSLSFEIGSESVGFSLSVSWLEFTATILHSILAIDNYFFILFLCSDFWFTSPEIVIIFAKSCFDASVLSWFLGFLSNSLRYTLLRVTLYFSTTASTKLCRTLSQFGSQFTPFEFTLNQFFAVSKGRNIRIFINVGVGTVVFLGLIFSCNVQWF